MERVNRIFNNKKFKKYADIIKKSEKERIYCRHGIEHSLDVARIALLLAYREGIEAEEDTIYAAALLHDIGRAALGEHRENSAEMAEEILDECGYEKAEIKKITEMILHHGNGAMAEEKTLRGIFYRADKLSRPCFMCKAREGCYWKEERKNLEIKI